MKKIIPLIIILIFSCEQKIKNYLPLGDEFEEIWKKAGEIEEETKFIAKSNLREGVFYILTPYRIYKFEENSIYLLNEIGGFLLSSSFFYPEKIMLKTEYEDSFIYILNIEENKIKKIKLPFSPLYFSFSPSDSSIFYFLLNNVLIKTDFENYDTIFISPEEQRKFFITKSGKIFIVTDYKIFLSKNEGDSFYLAFSSDSILKSVIIDEEENIYIFFEKSFLKTTDFNFLEKIQFPFEWNYLKSITGIGKGFIFAIFKNERVRVYKFKEKKFIEFSYGLEYKDEPFTTISKANGDSYLIVFTHYRTGEFSFEYSIFCYFRDTPFPP